MYHSPDAVTDALDASEARQRALATDGPIIGTVVIDLQPGDSAWNPTSTKHNLAGPLTVTYARYPDGGVEALVKPLRQTATA